RERVRGRCYRGAAPLSRRPSATDLSRLSRGEVKISVSYCAYEPKWLVGAAGGPGGAQAALVAEEADHRAGAAMLGDVREVRQARRACLRRQLVECFDRPAQRPHLEDSH